MFDKQKMMCLFICISRRFKTTEEGVKEMCEIIERNRAEAYAEGETRGEIRGTLKTLINLVKKIELPLKKRRRMPI